MTPPDKHVFLGLALCAALVSLPLINELPLWVLLAFAGLTAWRLLINQRGWRRPGRLTRLSLAVFMLVMVFRHFGTVMGYEAGLSLLLVMLGLKFLELHTRRDHVVGVLLCYLLILGNFLFSQSLPLALYMLGTVLVCTATLMQLDQPTSTLLARLRLAAGLAAKALPLMLIMYLLFPRLQGGLWGLPTSGSSGLTGMSDSMHMGSINNLLQSDAPAFRVRFAGTPPPPAARYWRGLVLWDTDGRNWSRGHRFPLGDSWPLDRRTEPVRYQVWLEATGKRWLYTLDLPATVPVGGVAKPGYVLESIKPVHERMGYEMASYPQGQALETHPDTWAASLRLPPDTSGRVRALAGRWRQQSADDAQVAEAALQYIRNEDFYYTLTPPLLGDDPVDEFLFESRRGFCEHYAAAFTVLMRAAGIPSRVVVGYQGGEFNETGGYLLVRQSDAHAWSEIWLPQQGWVRVDPTAAIAPARIEHGIDAIRRLQQQGLDGRGLGDEDLRRALALGWFAQARRQFAYTLDAINLTWFEWVMQFDPERQQRLLQALGLGAPGWLPKVTGLAGGVLLLVALWSVLLLRVRQPRDPLQRVYRRFTSKLARAGLPRRPAEGPLDFSRRVIRRRPHYKEDIAAITALYMQLRYGRTPDDAVLAQFKRQVARFRT